MLNRIFLHAQMARDGLYMILSCRLKRCFSTHRPRTVSGHKGQTEAGSDVVGPFVCARIVRGFPTLIVLICCRSEASARLVVVIALLATAVVALAAAVAVLTTVSECQLCSLGAHSLARNHPTLCTGSRNIRFGAHLYRNASAYVSLSVASCDLSE